MILCFKIAVVLAEILLEEDTSLMDKVKNFKKQIYFTHVQYTLSIKGEL